MAGVLTRSHLHGSELVRLLTELSAAGAEGTTASATQSALNSTLNSASNFAERMSDWFEVTDAISLSAALGRPVTQLAGGTPAGRSAEVGAVLGAYVSVQRALTESIRQGGMQAGTEGTSTGKARVKWPPSAPGATAEEAADYGPYLRFYNAHQRDMDAAIGPLRSHVRSVLSVQAPALQQLATLDAALAKTLAVRERQLLSAVPLLLEKRFNQLRKAHFANSEHSGLSAQQGDPGLSERPVRSEKPESPAQWMLPGGWLFTFYRDVQRLLLAELALRLEPVAGLVDALNQEVSDAQ